MTNQDRSYFHLSPTPLITPVGYGMTIPGAGECKAIVHLDEPVNTV